MFLISWATRGALLKRFTVLRSFLGGRPGLPVSATSALLTFSTLTILTLNAACSPGMFSGDGTDDKVNKTRNYRRINSACGRMNLSSNNIDVPTFRKIVQCFNGNGAIEEIEKLTLKLTDEELKPIVDVGNRYILNNKSLMFQMEGTYETLKDRKLLDPTFKQMARLLENQEFVAAGIAMLKESYSETGTRLDSIRTDMNVLRGIERLSTKLNATNIETGMDVALTVGTAQAFSQIQKHFRSASPSGRSLRGLTDQVLEFSRGRDQGRTAHLGQELIDHVIDGKLFRTLDEVIGTTPEQIRLGVPKMASILNVTGNIGYDSNGRRDAFILDDMTSLFHHLNQPIYCLKDSKVVPDATMHVIRELVGQNTEDAAGFIQRSNLITLMVMNPFCKYPPELGMYYGSMIRLADSMAVEPSTELLKSAYRNGLAETMVKILSDTGTFNSAGMKRLMPTIAELTERHIWDDLFFLASLPRMEDRDDIVSALQFVTEKTPQLAGKSLYDILTEIVARADSYNVFKFVYSLRHFTGSNEPLLVPALNTLRSAYYANDVHPLVDLSYDLLSTASQNRPFFDTMFRISELDEFQDAISLVSSMADDGRLEELMGVTVTLFHRFAQEGKNREIHAMSEPHFSPKRRHNFSSIDAHGDDYIKPWDESDPCRKLDTRVPMGDYTHGRFDEQLQNLLSCLNKDGSRGDVVNAIHFLQREKTSSGQPYFNLHMDLVSKLNLDAPELGDLADRWIRSVDDGRFYRLLNAIPFWLTRKVSGEGEPAGVAGPVLRPLFDLTPPIMRGAKENVRRLLDYAARVLRRADIPYLLEYGERLSSREPEPTSHPWISEYDEDRIMRWVGNKECVTSKGIQRNRTREIIHDYQNVVTSWEMPRYRWEREEFMAHLEWLFQKVADPKQNSKDKSILDALLNMMNYFTLPSDPELKYGANHPERTNKKHYSPEYLAKFMRERSDDYRLITYFYPDEKKPRVRLVNSLDRLELVLINADFTYLLPDNMGQKFLAMIGDAWGDEPPHVWPDAVQARFKATISQCSLDIPEEKRVQSRQNGQCPKTMREAFNDILFTLQLAEFGVGFPETPSCKQVANPMDPPELQRFETEGREGRSTGAPDFIVPHYVKAAVYNIKQVVSVIDENLPDSTGTSAGGMKVLRDLFYELYTSSPADGLGFAAGNKNNLSVITKLVRMGLTRQIGRQMSQFPPIPSNPNELSTENRMDYESVMDFYRAFVEGANAPDTKAMLETLLVKDRDHKLIWKVIDQIFSVLDAADSNTDERVLPSTRRLKLAGKAPEAKQQLRDEWKRQAAHMRQLTYFSVAQAGKMAVIRPAVKTIAPILDEFSDYLTEHADQLESMLSSKMVSYFMRALYEDRESPEQKEMFADLLRDALSDPSRGRDGFVILKTVDQAKPPAPKLSPWDIFVARMNVVKELDEFKNLEVEEILKQIFKFFQEDPTRGDRHTAVRIREYVAERISSKAHGSAPSELEEFLELAERKPDEFYQVLTTMSHYIENKELIDFVRLARRSISDPGSSAAAASTSSSSPK